MTFESNMLFACRRYITTIVLIAFITTGVLGGILALPQKAQAQITTGTVGPFATTLYSKNIELTFWQSVMTSGLSALMNTATMAGQQFAYDLAVGLASGAKGQNPLAFLSEPGTYFTQMGLDAVGNMIGELNEDWSALGLDLCQPRLPNIQLSIQLGLAEKFQRPKPKCEWSAIASNWESFANEVSDPAAVLKHLSLSFKPGATDLSQAQEVFAVATQRKAEAESTARTVRTGEWVGSGPIQDIISGNIKTPAQYTQEQYKEMAKEGSITGLDRQRGSTENMALASAIVGGGAWAAMGTTLISTFSNTLAARLLKMGMEGLTSLMAPAPIDLKSLIGTQPGGGGGVEGAKVAYEGIKVPVMQTTSYDVLTELTSCPKDKLDTAGLMQCVIDEQFAQAVREFNRGKPLSVKEAIENNYLDLDKPFGFADPTADPPIEPDYQIGYAYSNLKKLRFARIIPIGWEMAALKIKELVSTGKAGKNIYTFGDVYDGFSQAGKDKICGTNDEKESPFCGLMDPNWILKAPLAQCGAKVFSALSDGTGGRQEVCADLKNCLVENGKGGCESYGYCTREKNVWRIDGDLCDKQYASCETYKGIESKKELSLLETTLDFGTCNADNAGCKSYSRKGDPTKVGLNWFDETDPTKVGLNRVYLDGDAQKCKDKDAGCTEFIPNAHENLIANPSFENDEDKNNVPDGWLYSGVAPIISSDGSQSFSGPNAINKAALAQSIPMRSGARYTISVYGKGDGSQSATILWAFKDDTAASLSADLTDTNCQVSGTNLQLELKPGASYERASCSFNAPGKTASIVLTVNSFTQTNVWLDALQLEENSIATDFKEGYGSTSPQTTYLKKPPAWLGCDGEDGEPTECAANYARVCRQEEVGCEKYTPTTGDPAIPGIVSDLDRCPSECVGYASYKQESSDFEPKSFPNYLIPTKATACDIANVGCTEFTNITTEKLAYFNKLRACQKPTSDDGTYYTWEGAEKAGYQLRTWLLKVSNSSNVAGDKMVPGKTGAPPCTNIDVLSDPPTCLDTQTNQAICAAADVGVNGDCRAFYDKNGNIFYRLYSRTVTVTNQCEKYRITGSGQAMDAMSCTKYGGDWTASNKCQADADNDGIDEEYTNFDQMLCVWGRGSWDAQKNECLYAGYITESISCPATAKSCRLFTGNAGANVQTILGPETFESGANDWTGGAPSAEATSLGGHSLKIASGATAQKILPNPDLSKDTDYILSFWAKGELSSGKVNSAVQSSLFGKVNGGNQIFVFAKDYQKLTADWQLYNFGPLYLNADLTEAVLGLEADSGAVFVDNLILRRVEDKMPLLKNTITSSIPSSCDSLPAAMGGGYLPQAMLGCAEYKDRTDTTNYLKSFSSFCRDQSVGCQDLVDTYNSEAMEAKDWNTKNTGVCRGAGDCYIDPDGNGTLDKKVCTVAAGQTSCEYGPAVAGTPSDLDIDNLTVSRDKHVYLVVDDKKKCQAENRGCEAVGYQDPATKTWTTEYLKNNPDKYESILCKYEENNCASWISGTGTTYFKDPTTSICEWKTNIDIGGTDYSGWFKKGKDEPCYGVLTGGKIDFAQTYLIKGTAFGIWRNDDASYFGQAGECPKKQAGCTEFLDPVDTSGDNPKGKPYYYLDNKKIDRKTCDGKVSQKEGCALFNQTDLPELTWQAQASYTVSDKVGGGLVAPKPGSPNDANTILKVRRDRDCAEWLQCQSASWVWDPKAAKFKAICNDIGRCDQIPGVAEQGDITQCANWVDFGYCTAGNAAKLNIECHSNDDCNSLGKTDGKCEPKPLIASLYQTRDITWNGREFTGYSIPQMYPAEELEQVNLGKDDWRLVKSLGECSTKEVGDACTANSQSGKCYSGKCVVSPSGEEVVAKAPPQSCRAYPERDSPFPSTDAIKGINGAQVFADAKTCDQSDNTQGCECSYTKYTFSGAGVKYAASSSQKILDTAGIDILAKKGICQGSPGVDGLACDNNTVCQKLPEESGTCNKKSKTANYLGWQGLCLDQDPSRNINADQKQHPCLTWLPVDQLSGVPDVYNQYTTAGYTGSETWYCAQPQLYKISKSGSHHCYDADESGPCGEDDMNPCYNQVPSPPEGFWTLVTACNEWGEKCDWGGGDECPYKYIPYNSVHTKGDDKGTLCNPEAYKDDWDKKSRSNVYGDPGGGAMQEFTSNGLLEIWSDCQVVVPYNSSKTVKEGDYFAGCQLMTKVAGSAPKDNAAWTDRLFDSAAKSKYKLTGTLPYAYRYDAEPLYFGKISSLPTSPNEKILGLPTCQTDSGIKLPENTDGDVVCGDKETLFGNDATKPELAPELGVTLENRGRAYMKLDFGLFQDSITGSACTTQADCDTYAVNAVKCEPIYCLDPCTKDTDCGADQECVNKSEDPKKKLMVCQEKTTNALVKTPKNSCAECDSLDACRQGVCKANNMELTDSNDAPIKCSEAKDCYASAYKCLYYPQSLKSLCTPQYASATYTPSASDETSADVGVGLDRLKQLFATSYEYKNEPISWNTENKTLPIKLLPSVWNVTESGVGTDVPSAPKVLALKDCSSDKCQEGDEGLTVNEKSGGLVIGYNGYLKAALKFYAYADKNQMPLKELHIDWGDGTTGVDTTNSFYKNHRGGATCVSENQASSFGVVLDKSCDNAYFRYDHVYKCEGSTDDNWKAGSQCPSGEFQQRFNGCCVFKPQVQVKDNWGWCNGSCKGAPGGDGCYGAECDPQNTTSGAWTKFGGQILVAPKK